MVYLESVGCFEVIAESWDIYQDRGGTAGTPQNHRRRLDHRWGRPRGLTGLAVGNAVTGVLFNEDARGSTGGGEADDAAAAEARAASRFARQCVNRRMSVTDFIGQFRQARVRNRSGDSTVRKLSTCGQFAK